MDDNQPVTDPVRDAVQGMAIQANGQTLLAWWLFTTGALDSDFVAGEKGLFIKGRQSVGTELLALLAAHSPGAVATIMSKAHDIRREFASARADDGRYAV